MTYQADCTVPSDLLEQITEGGFDALPDAIRLLLNTPIGYLRDLGRFHPVRLLHDRESQ